MFEASTKIQNLQESKKWRPFHAKDFDSLMYPCFFICGIFGAFPYKRAFLGYTVSKTRFVYSTFTMILFSTLLLLLLHDVNFNLLALNSIPRMINLYLYIFMRGSIILLTYIQKGTKLRLLKHLSDVSSMLPPKDLNDLAKFVHLKDIGVFLLLASHAFNCVQTEMYQTLKNFITLYMLMFSFSMSMFYMNCVCVLKACFTKINEDLDQLKKPAAQEFSHRREKTFPLLMKLKNFQEKHLRISYAQQLVNRTFLMQTIVTSITTFTIVTFDLYFYILWCKGADDGENNHFWYVPYICSAIYHFLRFAMLIWACETATNRAGQIRTTLYNVLGQATDSTVKREVELFSLQLLHHKNTFSARVIQMNTSFLGHILGGIAMYLLILIQFLLNTVICMFKEARTEQYFQS